MKTERRKIGKIGIASHIADSLQAPPSPTVDEKQERYFRCNKCGKTIAKVKEWDHAGMCTIGFIGRTSGICGGGFTIEISKEEYYNQLKEWDQTVNELSPSPIDKEKPDFEKMADHFSDSFPIAPKSGGGEAYRLGLKDGYMTAYSECWTSHVLPLQEENKKLKEKKLEMATRLSEVSQRLFVIEGACNDNWSNFKKVEDELIQAREEIKTLKK